MKIFIHVDESGVFDVAHNDYYIYGGVIVFSREKAEVCARKYSAAENAIRHKHPKGMELKACQISNSDKNKLFRSLNQYCKFGVVINQNDLMARIFKSKKDKQRYLDYALKIGLKRAFEQLIEKHPRIKSEAEMIIVNADEHTTATNGRYELREGLLSEFKNGTYNMKYDKFYAPVFDRLKDVHVNYCDSEKKTLVRCADIVANKIYHSATRGKRMDEIPNLILTYLP